MRNFSFKSRFLIAMLLVAIVPLSIFSWINIKDTKLLLETIETDKINNYFNDIEDKTNKFFVNSENGIRFLKDVAQRELDNDEIDDKINHIQETMVDFARSNKEYLQLRLLDIDGNEVIRINNNNGPVAVKMPELQNKSDRYYFTQSLKLKANNIYKSEIDLNVENGKIEIPYMPTVRYSIPVVVDSKIEYFVILNLNLNVLIDQLDKESYENGYDKTLIFEGEGYYIMHYDSSKEWGNTQNLGTRYGFNKDHSEIYERLYESNLIRFDTHENTIVAWKKITIESLENKEFYTAVEIETQLFFNSIQSFNERFLIQIILYIAIVFVSGIVFTTFVTKPIYIIMEAISEIAKGNFNVAFEVGSNSEMQALAYEIKKMSYELESMYRDMEKRVRHRTMELEEANVAMKAMAETDPLTGLYNRHFFNKYSLRLEKGDFNNIIILIIDVNDFKYINDHYGHNTGDDILIEIARMLKKATRDTDFVVRYGGDEFLVILYNCDNEVADLYINRVNNLINEFNHESRLIDHNLDISLGYESYDGSGHILEAINSADEKMYKNKQKIKKVRGSLYERK